MKFRPRFSLRTLLVLVAVIGVVLGLLDRERRIVKERKRLIGDIVESFHGRRMGFDDETAEQSSGIKPDKTTWLRRWFGDEDFGLILLPADASEDLIQRAKSTFSHAYQMGPADERPHAFHVLGGS